VVAVSVVVIVLSYRPVLNLLSPHQAMNASFDPFRLVNTYGAFGSVTRRRYEVVVEGTDAERPDGAAWQEYEFKGKPGDPAKLPRQWAPYHLRLDWLMWFAAMSPAPSDPWLAPLLRNLLEGDPATTGLLSRDPFANSRPRYLRALYYRYRFTTPDERAKSGLWWHRDLLGVYIPPLDLTRLSRR
jgi:hypothetical protein